MKTRRFLARMVDQFLAGACVAVVKAISLVVFSALPVESISLPFHEAANFLLAVFLFLFVPILDAYRGRSFGKQFFEIRVFCERNDEYKEIKGEYFTSVLRNITLAIPFLNAIDLLFMFIRSDSGRLGDVVASTRVVQDPASRS